MVKKIKELIKFIDKKIDLKKFIKFGITGVLNTVVDTLVFALCFEIIGINSPVSKVIGVIAASINSYIINKNWTFQKRKNYSKTEIFKFLAMQSCYLMVNYLGMYILNERLGLNAYLSLIPLACITIPLNYFGNKLFVFK